MTETDLYTIVAYYLRGHWYTPAEVYAMRHSRERQGDGWAANPYTVTGLLNRAERGGDVPEGFLEWVSEGEASDDDE